MKKLPLENVLEAILFAAGDSVPLVRLAEAAELDIPATLGLLIRMADRYEREESGILIIEINDSFQLCTNPKYYEYARRLLPDTRPVTLTQPLLETLAIVAYKQPVTKAVIEEIRGVNADHTVGKLMEYGLIEEEGRLDAPGRPILFGTSEEFLRHFGLKSIDEIGEIL